VWGSVGWEEFQAEGQLSEVLAKLVGTSGAKTVRRESNVRSLESALGDGILK
jgi:hypothetical protein